MYGFDMRINIDVMFHMLHICKMSLTITKTNQGRDCLNIWDLRTELIDIARMG